MNVNRKMDRRAWCGALMVAALLGSSCDAGQLVGGSDASTVRIRFSCDGASGACVCAEDAAFCRPTLTGMRDAATRVVPEDSRTHDAAAVPVAPPDASVLRDAGGVVPRVDVGRGEPDSRGVVEPDIGGAGQPDAAPTHGDCTVFPADNPWNTDISDYRVHPRSVDFIRRLDGTKTLHPDFGTVWAGAPNGIPYVVVSGDQAKVPINFVAYGDESDPGPYPIPPDAPIEGGPDGRDDRHVIAVDMANCRLYELFRAFPLEGGGWEAMSGAVFDLTSNALRPIGWTSADAAGLPIYPGLVRRDEVTSGEITHALRVTFVKTQRAFVLPATHYASSDTDPNLPPMGLRLRLKASFDISGFSSTIQVILRALKKYGMFVADNGGDWFLSGAPSPQWNDDELRQLKQITGNAFEVVDTGPIYTAYTDVR